MPTQEHRWRLTDEQRKVVEENRWLAVKFAKDHRARYRLTQEDAESAAYLGLCRAVWGWNPEKGKLSTYAWLWMGQKLQNAQAASFLIHVPKNSGRAEAHVRQAHLIRAMRRADCGDDETASRLVIAEPVGSEYETREEVEAILAKAPEAARALIVEHVIHGAREEDIGKRRGVSKQAVSQHLARAMHVLRLSLSREAIA